MSREIKLTQGKVAIVDDEDFDYVNEYKWHYSSGYATHRLPPNKEKGEKYGKFLSMHRLVNKTPEGMDTDHINGNPLDNRKENLRTATTSQNLMNKNIGKRGVYCYKDGKRNKPWCARIKANRKYVCLGYYLTAEEAYAAYDRAVPIYHGEFGQLNSEVSYG
jgi:hypothetical protein